MIKKIINSNNFKTNLLYILRLICRYYIAFQMFSYAFGKILKSQFDLGLIYLGDESINHFNGFMLTWHYYGYSRAYVLIIASTQILASFLLLFRKTERLGVILFLSFMINILFVDIFYEINGALPMAIKLTLMGLFLLISDWSGFKEYFFKSKLMTHFFPKVLPSKFKNLYWVKFIIIPCMLFYGYKYINDIKSNFLVKKELFGVYKAIPENYSSRFFRVYFDYDNRLKIKDFNDNIYYGSFMIDSLKKVVTFNAKCYTETGAFIVNDSLKKMNLPKDSLKFYKKEIIAFYNSKRNSLPYKEMYNYEIKSDTLYLKNSLETIKMINQTKHYKH